MRTLLTPTRVRVTKKSNLEDLGSRGSATGEAVKMGHYFSLAEIRLARELKTCV